MRRQADEPDFYEVLGVETDATEAEIARAFRRQAFVHHPDRGGDADAFRELHRARETLLDPDHRADYDRRRAAPPPPRTDPRRTDPPRTDTPPTDGPADPFEWAAGAGPSTDDWSHAAGDQWSYTDPFAAYEAGYSWRRSDRFAWWKPPNRPNPNRRRG
ncbi:DnaJ domain-containing protein [Actinomycetes bacterium KLBMP 9797]